MVIQMTRAQYEAKYGTPPSSTVTPSPTSVTSSPAVSASTTQDTTAPIKMTRAQYEAKYGTTATNQEPSGINRFFRGVLSPVTKLTSSLSFIGKEGASVAAQLTGFDEKARELALQAEDIKNNGADFGLLGKVQPLGQKGTDLANLKEALGTGLEGGTLVAGGGAGVAKTVLGKAAQFGGLGALSGAGQSLSADQGIVDTLKNTALSGVAGAVTGGAFGVAGKGLKALGTLFGKAGDKIQTSVIKPTVADVKDGFSINTVNKYNLGGSLKQSFEKTDAAIDGLSKQLNAKLAQSNASVNLNTAYENTVKRLLGNKLENFGSNSKMENAIENLRNEITSVSGPNGLVSIPEAQLVKRASGHFGAWTFGNPTPEATASQKVFNTFYNEMKTAIEKNSPDGVREINKQISELIPVMNALIRRIPVAERNSTLSLSGIISLSAGILEPRALGLSVINYLSKKGSVGSYLSKNAPKIGNAAARAVQTLERPARVMQSK